MATARKTLGDKPISGNVDPLILMGKESKVAGHSWELLLLILPRSQIREAVRDCVHKARGVPHILNLGHGVIQPTPESAVSLHIVTLFLPH